MIPIPVPASTCVVVRAPEAGDRPEVFLVRRTSGASFLAGAHVFPGGRVDRDDAAAGESWCDGVAEAARRWPDLEMSASLAHHVAAIRELFEEAGLLLARDEPGRMVSGSGEAMRSRLEAGRAALNERRILFREFIQGAGLRLALDGLLPIGHWVTPAFEPKRFDTRFFVAVAPPEQVARHDAAETTQGTWMTADDALARAAREEILLFPPTWGTLRDLARFETVEEIVESTRERTIVRREPVLVEHDGQRLLVLPGDPLHPAPAGERVTEVHPETRFVFDGRRWVAAVRSARLTRTRRR